MAKSDWFNRARYGMVIHWGAYSVAGRGEWAMNRERIPFAEYRERYAARFLAEKYRPEEWARLARDAGMGYVVLTARHHDGFALWDTALRDFNSVQLGPRRDLIRPYVEAVRAAGLKVGLYYSVADWTHPDYPEPFARDWPKAWPDEGARKRFIAYYRAQLDELMTRYGKIDMLWYDGCIPDPTDGAEVNAFVRTLQPDILLNSRNGRQFEDFDNSEQAIHPAAPGKNWEACMTLNDSWGYHAGDHNWKSAREVIRMLTETAKGGGNLLLNVGPRADGSIPEESVAILRQAGDWLRRNGEFLADSERSPFSWNSFGNTTVKGNTVYLHLSNGPGEELCYTEIGNRVTSVRLVDGGTPVAFRQENNRLFLTGLPYPLRDPIATTLAIEVEGRPEPLTRQTTFWIPGNHPLDL